MPAKYTLIVNRCDDRLRVTVNGTVVYDKTTELDPALNDQVDITPQLQPHPFANTVVVQGFNGPTAVIRHVGGGVDTQHNPYNIQYRINKDGRSDIYYNHCTSHGLQDQGGGNREVCRFVHPIVLEPH